MFPTLLLFILCGQHRRTFLALRKINRSDGRLSGHRLAIRGRVLGALGTLVVAWAAVTVLYQLR